MSKKSVMGIVFFLLWVGVAQAEIHTEAMGYQHGEAELEGYLAFDSSIEGPRPGVLVVHEWKGLNKYAKGRAEQLAELGYIAFAVDMYGKGVLAADHKEAAELSGLYRQDRHLMRARVKAGLEVLKHQEQTDSARIAAIGYCFGGTTVLELARSGEALKGVVTFHGGLSTPHPEDAQHIQGKVLVLHGADDKHITQDDIKAFEAEMQNAGVDYRVIQYPGAVHSFTVPSAGDDPSKGMAYHPEADDKSWDEMKIFLGQIF